MRQTHPPYVQLTLAELSVEVTMGLTLAGPTTQMGSLLMVTPLVWEPELVMYRSPKLANQSNLWIYAQRLESFSSPVESREG